MCSPEVRKRLERVLLSLGLPTRTEADFAAVKSAMLHDKKSEGGGVTVIRVNEAGSYVSQKIEFGELFAELEEFFGEDSK